MWEARQLRSIALGCQNTILVLKPQLHLITTELPKHTTQTSYLAWRTERCFGHLHPQSWQPSCPRPHTSPWHVLPSKVTAALGCPPCSCIPHVCGLPIPTLPCNCAYPCTDLSIWCLPSASSITPDCCIPPCVHTHTLSHFLPPFFCLWS